MFLSRLRVKIQPDRSSWVRSIYSRSISNNVKVELERIPTNLVAEIPPETIAKILELIGRLSTLIDRASAAELAIFNIYGETEEVAYVLEQLDNTKERGEVAGSPVLMVISLAY